MIRTNGTIARRLLCAALICLLTVFSCACSAANTTQEGETTPGAGTPTETLFPTETPTPSGDPTPTLGFRDPTVTDVSGYAESGIPRLSGKYRKVWNLAREYRIENSVSGETDCTVALFKVLWGEDCLYVLVHVIDATYDTSAESVYNRDSVFFFINEDGKKNRVYSVGDACYIVDRDGNGYLGQGATGDGYECCVYDDGSGYGYYAEVRIPLMTVSGRFDRRIGFDVRVNNASGGKLKQMLQWADTDKHTDVTMSGVGTITMD